MQLDHVVFPVSNAARSIPFYRDVLGLPIVDALDGDDWNGKPWLMTMFEVGGGRQIVLVAFRGTKAKKPKAPDETRHMAFAVASERDRRAWQKRLAAAKVPFREENHGRQRSLYFEDPDGNVLEITAPPSRTTEKGRADAEKTVATWLADR